MNEHFLVAGLTFDLRFSARRKAISLSIDRGGGLYISAPSQCSREYIEHFIERKRIWIYKKLQEREQIFPPSRAKEFASGEDFYYLGRSYRLRLINDSTINPDLPALRLHQGWFVLKESEREHGQEHFLRWYIDHGQLWMRQRVNLYINQIGIIPSSINIKELGRRWGSCNHNNELDFHWRIVLLPPYIIDYIIVHELVHLREPRHNTDFWQSLSCIMPDFASRKQWLAKNGHRF